MRLFMHACYTAEITLSCGFVYAVMHVTSLMSACDAGFVQVTLIRLVSFVTPVCGTPLALCDASGWSIPSTPSVLYHDPRT